MIQHASTNDAELSNTKLKNVYISQGLFYCLYQVKNHEILKFFLEFLTFRGIFTAFIEGQHSSAVLVLRAPSLLRNISWQKKTWRAKRDDWKVDKN